MEIIWIVSYDDLKWLKRFNLFKSYSLHDQILNYPHVEQFHWIEHTHTNNHTSLNVDFCGISFFRSIIIRRSRYSSFIRSVEKCILMRLRMRTTRYSLITVCVRALKSDNSKQSNAMTSAAAAAVFRFYSTACILNSWRHSKYVFFFVLFCSSFAFVRALSLFLSHLDEPFHFGI